MPGPGGWGARHRVSRKFPIVQDVKEASQAQVVQGLQQPSEPVLQQAWEQVPLVWELKQQEAQA